MVGSQTTCPQMLDWGESETVVKMPAYSTSVLITKVKGLIAQAPVLCALLSLSLST